LFDIPPELGLQRIAANANREINRLDLEQLGFHQKVRDTYLLLAKRFKDRYIVIDASLPLATVIENTYMAIHQRLI
jgi:dTMP kinase